MNAFQRLFVVAMFSLPGLRESLVQKGRERSRLFTVEREIAEFISVFREVAMCGR